jgi:hypothetical protein
VPIAKGSDQPAKPPITHGEDIGARRINRQAEADAFRDKRLLQDLKDNANRSDLAKHRHEISATMEGNEDEDVGQDDDNGILSIHQDPEITG